MCLKMDIVAVWLPVCVSMKGLIPRIILSGLKNWLKMGFVVVDLAVTKLVKNYDISTN